MIFFGRTVKIENNSKVFWSLKRKTETFGLATLKANQLPLSRDKIQTTEVESVKEFFKTGVYEEVNYNDRSLYLKGQHWRYDDEQRKLRNWKYFCKRVWMTEDYLKKGHLDHPICVYWSPFSVSGVDNVRLDNDDFSNYIDDIENGEWQVCNGFGRAQFLGFHLKANDDVKVVAFNTFGKKLDFDSVIESEDDITKIYGEAHQFNYSLNWGTAIPYVNANISSKVNEISSEYHRRIHNWFKTTTITSNVKLSSFNLQPPNSYHRRKIKGSVHLELVPEYLKTDENGKYNHPFFNHKMVKACQILPLIDENNPFYQEDAFTLKYTLV